MLFRLTCFERAEAEAALGPESWELELPALRGRQAVALVHAYTCSGSLLDRQLDVQVLRHICGLMRVRASDSDLRKVLRREECEAHIC